MRPLLFVFVVLFGAAPAEAQQVEITSEEAGDAEAEIAPRDVLGGSPRALHGERFGAWLDAGFTGAGRSDERAEFVFSPELGVRFRPDRGLVVDAAWGFALATTSIRGEVTLGGDTISYAGTPVRFDPGNPRLSVSYSGAVAPDVYLEVGLGAAVPTASRAQIGVDAPGLVERSSSELNHRAAMAMRGYWSPWAWAPERFSLFVPVRIAGRLDDLLFHGEVGLGVMVPVLGDQGVDPDVVLQLAAGVGGRLSDALYIGVRLAGVGAPVGVTLPGPNAPGEPASEAVVFSAQPWLRLRFDPVQVTLRGVVNLNGADGVAGDRAPPFGLFVGVGGEVD